MRTTLFFVCCCLISSWSATSAQDTAITYQGQLQQSGEPFTGTANLEFRLYSQLSGGSQVGPTQTRSSWPVEDGLFQVELDFGLSAFTEQVRYLQVRVNGTNLAPRQAIRPSPMALFALGGNEGPAGPQGPAGPSGPPGDSSWEEVAAGIEYDDGRVRIGTGTFSSSRLRVDAGASMDGVHATSSTTGGFALWGVSNAPSGVGVRGEASVGPTFGVGGFHSSNSGTGVFGRANSSSGQTFGVTGVADSSEGIGVRGVADSSSGSNIGVMGETNSPNGFGVLGRVNSSSTSGISVGVKGENSAPGYAMWGDSTTTSGEAYGVIGSNDSAGGAGVLGRAFSGIGPVRGVWGVANSASGWGVYSTGRFAATGTKSFIIDHPLDPANQYLLHYSAEAPEPQNFYNGIIELDELGEAWIELPDYFTAINRDPRYSLTPIGGAMPNLHVAEEIDGMHDRGGFRVAGGQPGLRISWEVKAVRDDPFVRTRGAPVEVVKPESARGTYLHPELFGQPQELGESYLELRANSDAGTGASQPTRGPQS